MNRPLLTVVANADEAFFPGLAVAVASAMAAASGKFDYRFLILDGGIRPEAFQQLDTVTRRLAEHHRCRAELELLTVDQSRLSALPARRGSRMTYAKLVLPEILSDLDSLVYLDADVLCFTGLETLHPPIGEDKYLLAGARDFFAVIGKDCPWLDQVPANERKLPYINCGVMWMNLKGLREMDFTRRAIAARAAIGAARQGDQSVFNFLCRGRSFILPDAINHRTAIGSALPLCEGDLGLNLHYIGSPKPWLGPPKTSNWLAHQLWHQAASRLFPENLHRNFPGRPLDSAKIRRKMILYQVFNRQRAAHYSADLRSLQDPAGILEKADVYWKERLAP